jgi:hypothetical protein
LQAELGALRKEMFHPVGLADSASLAPLIRSAISHGETDMLASPSLSHHDYDVVLIN